MVIHYAKREGEAIQYFDVLSLFPYVRRYSKFPAGHPKIHVGDPCRDKQDMLSKEGQIKSTFLTTKGIPYSPAFPLQ